MESWQQGGFGLYVHWPFCQAKCPYCDFNSHVALEIDQRRWRDAYVAEVVRVAARSPDRVLQTVFFGGGTPSLMAPETVGAVIDAARAAWPVANDLEVTLEANPTSVEAGRFRGYRDAGVTRVSMGVQALNDADLRRLGRLHDASEARAAFEVAREVFERVSFDLIYARQGQSLASWKAELSEALAMAVDHLSLYQLTIEEGTPFAARHAAGGLRGLPGEDLAADMYDLTQELCEKAGLPAYEISNHARPGAESRHNLIYWRSGEWAGIGPGAHGRVSVSGVRLATEAERNPGRWLAALERAGHETTTRLGQEDCGEEYLMMGLRLREGCSMSRWLDFGEVSGKTLIINALAEEGWLWRSGDRIGATRRGRLVLNAVLARLLAV